MSFGDVVFIFGIEALWIGSCTLPVLVAVHWEKGGKRAGMYMLHISAIASLYWIGMTLRHFRIGPLGVRDHLPDAGFVLWMALILFVFVSAIRTARRPSSAYSLADEVRVFWTGCTSVFTATLLDEFTSSLDWIDMAMFFASVGLAALPLWWMLRRPVA